MQQFSPSDTHVVEFRQTIEDRLRRRVLESIEEVSEKELEKALGCLRYERTAARGAHEAGNAQPSSSICAECKAAPSSSANAPVHSATLYGHPRLGGAGHAACDAASPPPPNANPWPPRSLPAPAKSTASGRFPPPLAPPAPVRSPPAAPDGPSGERHRGRQLGGLPHSPPVLAAR